MRLAVPRAVDVTKFRERFFAMIMAKVYGIYLDADNFEIYVEVAALRDYWKDLGDPRAYSDETGRRRRELVNEVLRQLPAEETIIDRYDFFWTGPQRKKLRYPGQWDARQIRAVDLPEETKNGLVLLKSAFCSKPDFVIVSSDSVVMIEAKVESGMGKDQRLCQKLVSRLLRLVPRFAKAKITDIELTKDDAPSGKYAGFGTNMTGVSWREVVEMLDGIEIDPFSQRCLTSLMKYYKELETTDAASHCAVEDGNADAMS